MSEQQSKQSPIRSMISDKHFKNFLLYSFTYFVYGQIVNAIGPLIPYLAAHQNMSEPEYSPLFAGRALGYFLGPLLLLFIGNKFTYHQIIIAGVSLMALFSVLFDLSSSMWMRVICILWMMFGGSFIDTSINLSMIACFKGERLANWLQAVFGSFGVGGLLGPFLVYLFQLRSFTVLGLFSMLSAVICYFIPTPQKQVDAGSNEEQTPPTNPFPNTLLYLMAIGFAAIASQEASYGGWISSYAVLTGYSSKEHATFYPSLYWISITFFRFTLAVFQGRPTMKIKVLGMLAIVSTFVGLFLIHKVSATFGLTALTILYGMCDSILGPVMVTVANQFGYKMGMRQVTIAIIIASFSGYLAVVVGWLMDWFSYDWLLYSVCLINVVILASVMLITKIFQKYPDINAESSQNFEYIELKQKK